MKIEVRGVNFVNKGAELMLHGVVQQLRRWPGVQPVLGYGPGNLRGARRLGLPLLALWRKRWIDMRPPRRWLTPAVADRLALVAEQDVDGVLDASGFAYGDQWGPQPVQSLVQFLRRWKRDDRRFVLLPQALGPFRGPESGPAFAEVARLADRIYARDAASYEHVREVAGESDRLHLAPDFTTLVEGRVPEALRRLAGQVCFIPNSRMVDMTDPEQADCYRALMVRLLRLAAGSRGAFMLIHDRHGDEPLARALNRQLRRPLELVRQRDSLIIKGVLGRCHSVVSSRFHGLVSALSQGVPVLATGWSHKYKALLQDYGCPDQYLEDLADVDAAEANLRRLLEPSRHSEVAGAIRHAAAIEKDKARAMWLQLQTLVLGEA